MRACSRNCCAISSGVKTLSMPQFRYIIRDFSCSTIERNNACVVQV
jgi:hypothetical protein